MKHYKLVHTTPTHYVLHDLRDKKNFHVAIKGIDKNTSDTIKSLPPMNADSAENYDNDKPDNRDIPGTDPEPVEDQPQAYADGGKVAEMEAAHHPAPEQPERKNQITGSGTPMGNGFGDGNQQVPHFAAGTPEGTVANYVELPPSNPAVTDVSTAASNAALNTLNAPIPAANPNLPPDFEDRVKQEQQRLAVNAGTPGVTNTGIADGTDLSQFKTEAETNVAAMHQTAQSNAQQVTKDNYAAQVDKVNAANAVRSQAGLAPIPVPPPPSFPGAPTMPEQPGATISPNQQISVAPKSAQAGMGLPLTDVAGEYSRGVQQQAAGIQAGAKAQSEGANQAATAMQDYLINQEVQQNLYEQENATSKQHLDILEHAATTGKIDPNHYWNNKGTGGKIAAAVGLIFGGIGAGLTHQPSAALEIMQKAIQNDIEAQVQDKSNTMSLYKIGLEKYRDSRAAQQFATLQANALLQGQLAKISQSTGSAQSLATAQQMVGALRAQSAPIKQELDLKAMQMKMLNQPSQQQGGIDDQKLRIMSNMGFMPREVVAQAMKEKADYSQLSGVLEHADDVFHRALKSSGALNSGLLEHFPSIRPSSRDYDQLKSDWLGSITKETEGRVTPADVKLMEPNFPTFLDTKQPEVFNSKLNTIKDQIRNKYKFGVINDRSYGLTKPNDPILTPSSISNKRFTPGAPTIK